MIRTTIAYANLDGISAPDARARALDRAREILDDRGGVMYDDSRCIIVTDAEDTDEGVRVSTDLLSHDQVFERLTALTEQGYDFTQPIDRDVLLGEAA